MTMAWLAHMRLARPAHLLTATNGRPIKPCGVHIQRQARVTVGTFVSRLCCRVDGFGAFKLQRPWTRVPRRLQSRRCMARLWPSGGHCPLT